MKNKSGFTVVEVTIVIVIIAILSAISVVAYTKVQTDSRDSTRKGSVTVIAEALETYYTKNGEYPSVRSVVNNYAENTGTAIAAKLGIKPETLKMPKMPGSASNALFSAALPTNDYVSYIGTSAVNATNCQTVITGGCDEFTLKYYEESGPLVTIESRHKGRPDSAGTIPDSAAQPTIAVNSSGSNVVATGTAAACSPASLTQKFSFRYRVNGGAWSAYSTWSSTNTYTITGAQGSTYDFQAASRCDNGPVAGVSSIESSIVSYTYPINAPAAPVTTVTLSGSNALATIGAVTCPASTTVQYAIRSRVNDGTWSSYSAWGATLTSSQAANQGSKYGYQAKTRCQLGTTYSSESVGSEGVYIRPIATPTMATPTISTSGGYSTWAWTPTSCPAGTSAEYQEQDFTDWGFVSSWYGPYSSSVTTSGWTTDSEGYQYTETFQARCVSSFATSSWSATTQASYIRPVTAPGIPTNFVGSLQSDRKAVNWNWTAPGCANGIQNQDQKTARFSSSGAYGPYTAQGWWIPAWSQTITVNNQPVVIGAGSQFQIKAKYVCVNATTGRQSAYGPEGTSPLFTAP